MTLLVAWCSQGIRRDPLPPKFRCVVELPQSVLENTLKYCKDIILQYCIIISYNIILYIYIIIVRWGKLFFSEPIKLPTKQNDIKLICEALTCHDLSTAILSDNYIQLSQRLKSCVRCKLRSHHLQPVNMWHSVVCQDMWNNSSGHEHHNLWCTWKSSNFPGTLPCFCMSGTISYPPY